MWIFQNSADPPEPPCESCPQHAAQWEPQWSPCCSNRSSLCRLLPLVFAHPNRLGGFAAQRYFKSINGIDRRVPCRSPPHHHHARLRNTSHMHQVVLHLPG